MKKLGNNAFDFQQPVKKLGNNIFNFEQPVKELGNKMYLTLNSLWKS